MRILKIGFIILLVGLFSSLNAKWGDMKTDKQIEAEQIAKQNAMQYTEQEVKQSVQKKDIDKADKRADARLAINKFKKENLKINEFFTTAYAYVVFPNVAKAGIGFGGAYGSGVVYKNLKVAGYSSMSQLTYGFQLGAQVYSEIIFFKNEATYEIFKHGNFEIGMNASAVVIKEGLSFALEYTDGVAVFARSKVGLMYELSFGGQKFTFEDK